MPLSNEEALFALAVSKPAAERRAWLDRECGDDKALRARLEALLAAHEASAGVLGEEPAAALLAPTLDLPEGPPDEAVGTTLGRYKLREKLGVGGCGVVYVAEQTEPVQRRVALKVIKLGMDTREVIARFEAERQALAMMDHPNIAKVFDAGTTESGRPYFVMELVRGIRITDYCDQANLSTKERLDLFIKVCQAIQHAHQKGIIHRDIKPSNILVTLHDGVPVPKVIDFGIAKATEGRLTDATVYTQLHQFIGTPAYMSPEQAEMSGLDIDTRSDIYSLGVLLYQLLTSKTPFDGKELLALGIDEMRRTIREKEPMRPSTRLATLQGDELTTTAKRRSADAPKLIHLLKGDLDWIVMKCLEKDRTRRYDTANGLAQDIVRHLANEPVVARPPSTAYRLQKLARRNRVAFAATGVVAAALILGVFISTWQAVRATRAERQQNRLRQQAQANEQIAQQAQANEAKLRAESEERLYDSLVSEARHKRREHRVGYRDEVFKILQQANALNVPQKNLAELRSAAVACMGDLAGFAPVTFTNFPNDTRIRQTQIDPTGQIAGFRLMDGTILMLKLSSGEVLDRLSVKPPRGWFHFNSTGDDLIYDYQLTPAGWGASLWTRAADGRWHEKQNVALPEHWQLMHSAERDFGCMADLEPRSHKLVDLKTTNVVLRFELPAGIDPRLVTEATLSRDGRFLVMSWKASPSSPNFVIDLWDLNSGRNLKRFEPGFRDLASLNFSPDGKYLACLSGSGGALYAMDGVERVANFAESFKGPFTTSFSFSNTVIALPIQSKDSVRLWDWVNQRDFAVLEEPEGAREATFAPDGRFLLTSGRWSARLYRWPSMTEKLVLPKLKPVMPCPTAFSADSQRIAASCEDGKVRVLDAATGRTLWEPGLPPDAASSQGYGCDVAMSPDGLFAVGGSQTQQIWIWDERERKLLAESGTNQSGAVAKMQFTPDGRHLVALFVVRGSTNQESSLQVKAWKITRLSEGVEGKIEFKLLLTESVGRTWSDFAVSPDQRHFALCTDPTGDSSRPQSELRVWQLDSPTAPRLLSGNSRCTFTPDGKQLLTIGRDRAVVTVDVETGATVPPSFSVILPNSPPEISFPFAGRWIALSPGGTRLAVMSADGRSFDIWSWKSRRYLYSLPVQDGVVTGIWSPDSLRLVVAHEFGGAAIWNIQEVEQVLAKLGLGP